MKKIYCILSLSTLILMGCKKDFITRQPLDQLSDETFWTNENNVRTFAWGFYTAYFPGYGSGFTFGNYFSGQSLNDDFAPTNPPQFTKNIPASGGGWSFTWVRKANLFIDRIQRVPMDEEATKHWTGIARFFRGLEYHDLVKRFGDIPWYSKVLDETDSVQLYKPRDSRTLVMDSVLADFQYAAQNVRLSDGNDAEKGMVVNRYVVLAYMSRVFLFEGTYQKYHNIDQARAKIYLEAAKWAADEVIKSGKYSMTDDYRTVFSSLSLASAKEVLLYRKYETAMVTHSLNSYVNKEPQTGPSKDAIEAYLSSDGLPIRVSPLYAGDKTIADVMTQRDPRLSATFVNTLRISKYAFNYSTSGYATHKFLNESIKELPEGSGSLNPTDAPIIRFGEVLVNYAEAAAELGILTQADLDKSINKLRKRPGINMPDLLMNGSEPAVNIGGTVTSYDDPDRDPTVPAMIWEIRRERRVELMMEGFRYSDLLRWKKLDYTHTVNNADINRGAWIKKSNYPNSDVKIEGGAAEGYIIPAFKPESQRLFTDPKVYLNPLPLDQIKLYSDKGVTLAQNPGWQ